MKIPVAFDVTLGKPACVLVAAGMGASIEAAMRFPVESWLLAPTPAMAVYLTTEDQLNTLVERVSNV